jgi:hypothetical protein
MTDHAYADRISGVTLESLLATDFGLTEMILEAVDEVRFEDFTARIDLDRFECGRAFGPRCEIRWQRDGENFQSVLIGDSLQVPDGLNAYHIELTGDTYSAELTSYYMWGEWTTANPVWMEAAIPHLFNYKEPAVPGRWKLKLASIDYVNRHSGIVEFQRFTGTVQERIHEPV